MSPISSIEITPMNPSERSTVIAVTARAFWDDPLFNFFMPDLGRQHRLAPVFFAANIDDCAGWGEVHVARIDGTLAGAAAWLPPGVVIGPDWRRTARHNAQLVRVLAVASNRRLATALLRELPRRDIAEDHWFLSILATDPLMQGRGIGTALLEPMLARADDGEAPVFLRTQREANLAYYGRFGFDVTDRIELPQSPTVWTMTRRPR